jgi:pimeloyl-ACP methyl ester carboxylesterase
VVLLHGLTATRDYVLMGSDLLERAGHRIVAYDARGHGKSSPAPRAGDYGYDLLERDLVEVMDHCGLRKAALVGVSMGAHTALRLALDAPERVAALVVVTPGFDPAEVADPVARTRWRPLAETLRRSGPDAFARDYPLPELRPARARAIRSAIRRRLRAHAAPGAVADAMRAMESSWPFGSLEPLASVTARTLVVASRDDFDPEHPYALAERYAATIPRAELVSEPPGRLPLAWRGAELSELVRRHLASHPGLV